MKTPVVQTFLIVVSILCIPITILAQVPSMGTAASYVLFTKTGSLGSTGISNVSGNIGTNNGAITGFIPPTTVIGTIDSGNAATIKCAADLQLAYNQLFNTPPTSTGHAPAFGTGETLFAGVYAIAGAGSVAADLTLDAQGNPNATFIFKFGGAFTTGASTTIHLINGASACNVFWAAEGAIAMAAQTVMKGTLIANNGAVSMGMNGNLEGRLLSTTGAASIYSVIVSLPCSLPTLPVRLISFTGSCENHNVLLAWTTATEINSDYFTVERSAGGIDWQVVGRVGASGTANEKHDYTLIDAAAGKETSFYRLKQTNVNGNFHYGSVIAVRKCGNDQPESLISYPNPSLGKFALLYDGNNDPTASVEIYNFASQRVYKSVAGQSNFDLSNQPQGVYYILVRRNSMMLQGSIMIVK